MKHWAISADCRGKSSKLTVVERLGTFVGCHDLQQRIDR